MRFGFLILLIGLLAGCGGQKEKADVLKCQTALTVMDHLNDTTPDIDRSRTIADIKVSCKTVFSSDSSFKKIALEAVESRFGTGVVLSDLEVGKNTAVAFEKALSGRFSPKKYRSDGDSHESFLFYVEKKSYRWVLQTY